MEQTKLPIFSSFNFHPSSVLNWCLNQVNISRHVNQKFFSRLSAPIFVSSLYFSVLLLLLLSGSPCCIWNQAFPLPFPLIHPVTITFTLSFGPPQYLPSFFPFHVFLCSPLFSFLDFPSKKTKRLPKWKRNFLCIFLPLFFSFYLMPFFLFFGPKSTKLNINQVRPIFLSLICFYFFSVFSVTFTSRFLKKNCLHKL